MPISKKIINITLVILLVLFIILFQTFLVNKRDLFGIKPNLILVLVVTVSLWYGVYTGSFFALITGIYTNILYASDIPLFIISYSIVGCIVGLLSDNYRKENRGTLMYVIIFSTAIFEVIMYISYIVITKEMLSIFFLIKQVILSSILNIVFGYILYNLMKKISLRVTNDNNIYFKS